MHIIILLLGLNTSFLLDWNSSYVKFVSICSSVSATGLASRNYRSFSLDPTFTKVWDDQTLMPTPQMTLDDANPETTYKTTKFCYKSDRNI